MKHHSINDLDPVQDAATRERIAHAKTCSHWSIIENVCGGHTCGCGRFWVGSLVCDQCRAEGKTIEEKVSVARKTALGMNLVKKLFCARCDAIKKVPLSVDKALCGCGGEMK